MSTPYRRSSPGRAGSFSVNREALSQGIGWLVPALTTLTFLVFSALPWGLIGLPRTAPALGLMAVYIWAVRRPSSMPLGLAFGLGLVQDLLWGEPLGLWGAGFVAGTMAARAVHTPFHVDSLTVHWLGFLYVLGVTSVLVWLLACLYYGQFLSFGPLLGQGLLTAALYPLGAFLLRSVR